MKKYEYKLVVLNRAGLFKEINYPNISGDWSNRPPYDLAFANKLGDEGWELVNFQCENHKYLFTFKREKQ